MADYTQADLDKLNQAIASGARQVSIGDQTVIFRSQREMTTLREEMRAALSGASAASAARRRRHIRVSTRSGW